MKKQILAYLTSTINQYQRAYEIEDACTASNVINDLKDFETFLMDLNEDTTDNTLELNADHTENMRAYKTTLETIAQQECTITTQAMDLYNFGYIEKENKMLEIENLELKSRLAMASVSGREIRELKAENQLWQSICNEQKAKIEKLTGPHWVD